MINLDMEFPSSTRFLITGGAGFIGSNLVEKILALGYRVRVLDNFSTGKKNNLEKFHLNPNFQLIEGDMRNSEDCEKSCEGIDFVLHQGALGSVIGSIKDPRTWNDVNITGTLNMMLAARKHMVKRFVYASSSAVYGDDPHLPKKEDMIVKPLSPYAITKRVNELYAKNFWEIYGLPTVGLRYFNVFGKRQDPHSVYAAVIPIFVKSLLNNEQPIINGDGSHSRDFVYIDDVIQGNLRACLVNDKAFGEVYNIAYGDKICLTDLYYRIAQLLDKSIKPTYGPEIKGDIKHSSADITKAKKLLSYYPKYPIHQGLELTIDWYKNQL